MNPKLSILKPFNWKVFFKLSEKQPFIFSKQPIVLYLGVFRKVENCFWWLTCCQTKTTDWFEHSTDCLFFGTIIENCFVLWLNIKWFYNWIHSSFKCFDQSLNEINSLFRLCNKQLRFSQRKTNLSFSLILLLKKLEIAFEIAWIKESVI